MCLAFYNFYITYIRFLNNIQEECLQKDDRKRERKRILVSNIQKRLFDETCKSLRKINKTDEHTHIRVFEKEMTA